MNTSLARRTGLALSLIASLALRASAQTSDAAFAAALDQASFIATMAQQPRRPAPKPAPKPAPAPKPEAKPASAPDAVWQKIIEAVKADGVFKPETHRTPAIFEIEEVDGDLKGDHTLQSVGFAGSINGDGQFEAMGAVLIFKESKLDPQSGARRTDQWMLQTDVHGEVAFAMHAVKIEIPDGESIPMPAEPLTPADPKVRAQYDSMLKHWAERKP